MNSHLLTAFLCLVAGQTGESSTPPFSVDLPTSVSGMPVYLTDQIPCLECANGCRERFWVRGEYLLWWTKNGPLPVALATQGSAADPVPAALGQPGTRVLYGNQDIRFDPTSGYRITAGFRVRPDSGLFVEGSWMQLGTQTSHFSVSSDNSGSPILGQPITNAVTGAQNSELLSFPNPFGFAGNIRVDSTSRLQGYNINLGFDAGGSNGRQFEMLAGFRSLNLRESLSIQSSFSDVSGAPGGAGLTFLGVVDTVGSVITTMDSFQTSNNFYGGQLGGRFTQEWGRFTLGLQGKLALGATHEVVTINGASSLLTPGAVPVTVPGGLLALPSNSGQYSRNVFSVIPEGALTLGVQLTPRLRATAGYDILYWNNVARPGNEIDTTVNRANVPTATHFAPTPSPTQPAFQGFNSSGYWAQGISFGLEFRY